MRIPWRKAGTNLAFWVWSLFMIALGAVITTWAVPEMIDRLNGTELTRTELRLYQPFSSTLDLSENLAVTERVQGRCTPQFSNGDFGNVNASRCTSESSIYDPCFSPFGVVAQGDGIVCPVAPWLDQVVVLTPTHVEPIKPIRNEEDAKQRQRELEQRQKEALPWAIELENGFGCIFAQGATGEVAGRRINYFCHRRGEPLRYDPISGPQWSGEIVGNPDRSEDVWRVEFSETGSETTHFHEIAVQRVWY